MHGHVVVAVGRPGNARDGVLDTLDMEFGVEPQLTVTNGDHVGDGA